MSTNDAAAARTKTNTDTQATDEPRLFGTDGIRGPAGEAPLNRDTVVSLAVALGRIGGGPRRAGRAPSACRQRVFFPSAAPPSEGQEAVADLSQLVWELLPRPGLRLAAELWTSWRGQPLWTS